MLEFLKENIGTIIAGGIVLLVVLFVLLKMRRDKKNHKTSCGCGCSGCPSSEICHKEDLKE